MKPIGGIGGANDVFALRQQIIDRSDALKALRANKAENSFAQVSDKATSSIGEGFKSALNAVNESQLRAQNISAAYERGEVTDVAKVMIARQEAGVAFEATLQVRNKLLNAYQEIMRMGV